VPARDIAAIVISIRFIFRFFVWVTFKSCGQWTLTSLIVPRFG
jgi:hypothetical protein